MNFKFLKMAFASLLLSTGGMSHAALITHNGYTLDTETDIVTGGGYEWLQWDVTVGYTINDALAADGFFYGGTDYGRGWTLASNVAVASLFTSFGFNSTINEKLRVNTYSHYTIGDNTVYDHFLELFGETWREAGYSYGTGDDALSLVTALYGSDQDNDNKFNIAQVISDYYEYDDDGLFVRTGRNEAILHSDRWSSSYGNNRALRTTSVALVRAQVSGDVVSVPETSSVALFGLGLGLVFRRRMMNQA